jgi:hypothetical protein
MGQLKHEQEQLFYEFRLDEVVPGDHLVREIAAVLDLTWVRAELASYYSPLGRPTIDPVLMIRMLIVGYVFAIRSERLLCLLNWSPDHHQHQPLRVLRNHCGSGHSVKVGSQWSIRQREPQKIASATSLL